MAEYKVGLQDLSIILDLDLSKRHDQFVLWCFEHIQCYEGEVVWVLLRTLKPGDIAVDVGANIGFHTVLMAKLVGPTGKVFAIEPMAEQRKRLEVNLAKNELSNVEIIPYPAWSTAEEVTFWIDSDDESSSCLWDPGLWFENAKSRANPSPHKTVSVTLDDVCAGAVPKLIKIDTEGAEMAVLQGAVKTLRRCVPYVVVELNPFGLGQFKEDTEHFREFMAWKGYDLFFLHGNGMLPTFVPRKVVVEYERQWTVKNALFSTSDAVAQAWPKAGE